MQNKFASSIIFIALLLVVACQKKDTHPVQPTDPVIAAIWPVSGQASTIVRIIGRHFRTTNTENKVWFNGVEATVIESSSTEIQAVAPEAAGSGPVKLQVQNKEVTGPEFTYTEAQESYIVSTLAGGTSAGFVDGIYSAAMFKNPEGVAVNPLGGIIVTDRENNAIRKISANGTVTTLAGDGTKGFANGNMADAVFSYPWKSDVDAAGNIVVADRDNFMIRKISVDGTVTTLAGSGSAGYADGAGAAAKFKQPLDVAFDPDGNVIVADNTGHLIRKVAPDGTVSTIAGDGIAGNSDGDGTNARFKNPSGLTFDKDGNIIVADRLNNLIRKITPDGKVSTIAGDGTTGYVDGDAMSARFSGPYGVAVDSKGNIIVADLGNNKIRKITPSGKVSTIAGSSRGYSDGPGISAAFYNPTDVAVDANDNIYVADNGNHAIRKIRLVK